MMLKKISYFFLITITFIIFSFNSAIAKEFKCKCVKFSRVNSIANRSMAPNKECFKNYLYLNYEDGWFSLKMLERNQVLNISQDTKKFVSASKITHSNDTNVHFKKESQTLKFVDIFFDEETTLKMEVSFTAKCK
jgi:hypothetical protein